MDDKSIIDEINITFKGFDGNNEGRLMRFTQALKENDRFTDIIEKGQLNSHSPKKNQYRKMLNNWKELNEKENQRWSHLFEQLKAYL